MRRLFTGAIMALAVAGLGAAGPGCSSLTGDAPVAGQTKADEVALGIAVAAGTAANNAYALSIESKVLTDKALSEMIFARLGQYDRVLAAARQAKAVGDATGLLARLAEAQSLIVEINALIPHKGA